MQYTLIQLQINLKQGTLLVTPVAFEFDDFAVIATALLQRLDAVLVAQEYSADLQQWLIDFEGCQLLLKAEYYSASMWLELLTLNDLEHLIFIQQLLSHY
ncbi:DUF3630 family protein [Photobacterium sp. S4TG1]|uniref:DUF3630 family protein n=1 Tax=Photobacterium sp. S4TG1 TaxID=3114587 RepID=UPI002E172D3A|nr:DUF3630 family protein [Photobacterium sp. S4TG1]